VHLGGTFPSTAGLFLYRGGTLALQALYTLLVLQSQNITKVFESRTQQSSLLLPSTKLKSP